jgi:hypothetical protein
MGLRISREAPQQDILAKGQRYSTGIPPSLAATYLVWKVQRPVKTPEPELR